MEQTQQKKKHHLIREALVAYPVSSSSNGSGNSSNSSGTTYSDIFDSFLSITIKLNNNNNICDRPQCFELFSTVFRNNVPNKD